ncbi:alkaline phosphatase [Saccharopolyspora shandongensis]|uniref:alkaline phosphatase n=1 Tax=Saccharopolyspora shandongensis TaxID=418495 RepID=UPI0033ED2E61
MNASGAAGHQRSPAQQAAGRQGALLQVVGARIDKQEHATNPCGQISETGGLDEAAKAATDFVRSHPETLALVSAGSGHTSQIIPNDAKSPGQTATLIINEGVPMTLGHTKGFVIGRWPATSPIATPSGAPAVSWPCSLAA